MSPCERLLSLRQDTTKTCREMTNTNPIDSNVIDTSPELNTFWAALLKQLEVKEKL